MVSESEAQTHLSAGQLLRFLKDPAKDYLSQQLHVKLDALDWMESHEDQEQFGLDGLESWSLRKRVFDTWLMAKQQGKLTEQFAEQLKRQWQLDLTLPIGHAGEAVWSSQVCPVLDALETYLSDVELCKGHFSRVVGDVQYQDEYWENADGQRERLLEPNAWLAERLIGGTPNSLSITFRNNGQAVDSLVCRWTLIAFARLDVRGLVCLDRWLRRVLQSPIVGSCRGAVR